MNPSTPALPTFVRIDNVGAVYPDRPIVTLSCGHKVRFNGGVERFRVGARMMFGCSECNSVNSSTPAAASVR